VRRIDVGKLPKFHKVPQEAINALLVDLAREGLVVARLKGGDPMIFGRGSEEAEACRLAGVGVSYVPGITSAQGAASSTGVPLTHRGLATGVRYVTGHRAKDAALDLDWASLASEETTLVVYMGAGNIAEIALQLMRHGMAPALPVLAVSLPPPRPREDAASVDAGPDRHRCGEGAARSAGPVRHRPGRRDVFRDRRTGCRPLRGGRDGRLCVALRPDGCWRCPRCRQCRRTARQSWSIWCCKTAGRATG
jgi:hypothetical protein